MMSNMDDDGDGEKEAMRISEIIDRVAKEVTGRKKNAYLHSATIRLLVATFNMGNARANNLSHLVPKNGLGLDLIALGFQESVYDTENIGMMLDSRDHLQSALQTVLGEEFYLVEVHRRAQMQMYIFARTTLQGHIKNIEKSAENTGFLHLLPNKGGLCISLNVYGTILSFVSCHLAAHEGVKKCQQRNESIEEILGGIRSGNKKLDPSVISHHMFWMGDMNYRLTFDPSTPADSISTNNMNETYTTNNNNNNSNNTSNSPINKSNNNKDNKLTVDEDDDENDEDLNTNDSPTAAARDGKLKDFLTISDMIQKKQWSTLLQYDELNRELSAGRVLEGFTALQPTFPPTFKRIRQEALPIDNNKPIIDLSESLDINNPLSQYYNKKRLPSYTDRILYKSLPGFKEYLELLYFDSIEKMTSSDHKPVHAAFLIDTIPDDHGILARSDKKGSFDMFLTDLKGYDLKEMDSAMFGGLSDPYLIIFTDPLKLYDETKSIVKSSVITHNVNPIWSDQLKLHIVTSDYMGLKSNAHLFISVWDKDYTNADDLIGTLSVPFYDIIQALQGNKPYIFQGYLINNGRKCGKLSGKISIKTKLPPTLRQSRVNDPNDPTTDINLSEKETHIETKWSCMDRCNVM